MKRVLLVSIAAFLLVFVSSCGLNKNTSKELLENSTFQEEEIDFEIEKILFSKSFQSTEPTVELISKNNKIRLMASLGLSEYSGININNVIKKGNEINIHVSGITKKRNIRLAVPQVIMELKKLQTNNVDDLKFNIVYDDYTPLKIKLSINDLANLVQSHFKVSLKSMPEFNLEKVEKDIVWNISYNSIFDRDHPGIPLVNLKAKIDANSGDILNSEKVFISSLLDKGQVLGYISGKDLLYKKTIHDSEINKTLEQLWIYDVESKKKSLIYSSNFKISLAEISPDCQYISLIETSDGGSEIFIVAMEDLRTYKVFIDEHVNPNMIRWAKNNILYLIDTRETSRIYSYDIENHEVNLIKSLDKIIENVLIQDDGFVLIERNQDNINKKISYTRDWENYREIGHGFIPRFVNGELLSFLKNNDKSDTNSLIIYNIKNRDTLKEIDDNIVGYQILSDNQLAYVKRNMSNNQFELIKYSIADDSDDFIASMIGSNVYYNENKNLAYLNIVLPFEDEKTEVIYTIDLSKLN